MFEFGQVVMSVEAHVRLPPAAKAQAFITITTITIIITITTITTNITITIITHQSHHCNQHLHHTHAEGRVDKIARILNTHLQLIIR